MQDSIVEVCAQLPLHALQASLCLLYRRDPAHQKSLLLEALVGHFERGKITPNLSQAGQHPNQVWTSKPAIVPAKILNIPPSCAHRLPLPARGFCRRGRHCPTCSQAEDTAKTT